MATQDVNAPTLGAQGEPCQACGAPLAGDQRYCLQCGTRRTEARLPFREILAGEAAAPPTAVVPSSAPAGGDPGQPMRAGLTFLAGLGCLLLALGVGVLIGRSGDRTTTVTGAAPAPQVISVGGAAAAPGTTSAPGATSTTPGTTTAPSSSSGSSSSKGAGSSKAKNKSLKALDNSSGSDYEKKSSKLPKTVGTGGKPPPKDNKPAGGGTDFQTIG
jgi:hypothetical protein